MKSKFDKQLCFIVEVRKFGLGLEPLVNIVILSSSKKNYLWPCLSAIKVKNVLFSKLIL